MQIRFCGHSHKLSCFDADSTKKNKKRSNEQLAFTSQRLYMVYNQHVAWPFNRSLLLLISQIVDTANDIRLCAKFIWTKYENFHPFAHIRNNLVGQTNDLFAIQAQTKSYSEKRKEKKKPKKKDHRAKSQCFHSYITTSRKEIGCL